MANLRMVLGYWGEVFDRAFHRLDKVGAIVSALLLIMSGFFLVMGLSSGDEWLSKSAGIVMLAIIAWNFLYWPARMSSDLQSKIERSKVIAQLTDYIVEGNRIMEVYGRPEWNRDLKGLEAMSEWNWKVGSCIDKNCPEFLADFQNDGYQIFGQDKSVWISQLDGRLARLHGVIKELRSQSNRNT